MALFVNNTKLEAPISGNVVLKPYESSFIDELGGKKLEDTTYDYVKCGKDKTGKVKYVWREREQLGNGVWARPARVSRQRLTRTIQRILDDPYRAEEPPEPAWHGESPLAQLEL